MSIRNKMAAEWIPMTVFVFFYVLTLRTFYKLLSKAADMILRILNKVDSKEEALIEEMKNLVAEQQQISAQDEFAKYVRLQRKVDKLKDDVKAYGSARKTTEGKHKIVSKILVMLLIIVIHISFLVTYRKDPVIILPQQWFYPFHNVLSFPTGIPGAIGLPCWMITCNKMIEKFVI